MGATDTVDFLFSPPVHHSTWNMENGLEKGKVENLGQGKEREEVGSSVIMMLY